MGKNRVPRQSLIEHLVSVFRQEFESLDWRKFKNDLVNGAYVGLGGIVISVIFGLSTKPDWEEHPVALVTVALLPLSILACDVGWRCWKAFRRIYRERSVSFRDTVQSIAVTLCGSFMLVAFGFFVRYITSPHLKLGLAEIVVFDGDVPYRGKFGIAHLREAPQPNTVFTFNQVIVSNTGVPSRAKNWRLIVNPAHGDPVIGIPYTKGIQITQPQDSSKQWLTYFPQQTIFFKSQQLIANEIRGMATFYVEGMSDDVARQPGTKLTLECDDDRGTTYSVKEPVPTKELTHPPKL